MYNYEEELTSMTGHEDPSREHSISLLSPSESPSSARNQLKTTSWSSWKFCYVRSPALDKGQHYVRGSSRCREVPVVNHHWPRWIWGISWSWDWCPARRSWWYLPRTYRYRSRADFPQCRIWRVFHPLSHNSHRLLNILCQCLLIMTLLLTFNNLSSSIVVEAPLHIVVLTLEADFAPEADTDQGRFWLWGTQTSSEGGDDQEQNTPLHNWLLKYSSSGWKVSVDCEVSLCLWYPDGLLCRSDWGESRESQDTWLRLRLSVRWGELKLVILLSGLTLVGHAQTGVCCLTLLSLHTILAGIDIQLRKENIF